MNKIARLAHSAARKWEMTDKCLPNKYLLYRDQNLSLEMVQSDGNREDWTSFFDICVHSFQNDVVYKQLYQDDEQRSKFLKSYYEHLYRCAYKDDLGSLAYLQATDMKTKAKYMVGGLTISKEWNEKEQEDPKMKFINEIAWEKYIRHDRWLHRNIYQRFLDVSGSVGKKLVYRKNRVLLNDYRYIIPSGVWADIGAQMMLEHSYGETWKSDCIVVAMTDNPPLARHLSRHKCKVVQIYQCDDGNFFKGNKIDTKNEGDDELLIFVYLYGMNDNEELFNYIKYKTHDKTCSLNDNTVKEIMLKQ
uniref:uncharacterized protein LOC120329310 isoform X1 n=1 Tax=Styela clava TaxID=7725 RepID=UPI001939D7F7|nr:uncharacterized protein LOC120329310 isoform X1 [Styela clava]